jgi:DNA mismatch repair ATPase MutS
MFDILSMSWFGLVFCSFTIASSKLIRKITLIQESYNKTLKMLSTYVHLIELADKQSMESPLLTSLKKEFESHGKKAPLILSILAKELDRLDLRNNLILYALLEGSMFWQLRQMLRIERWKEEYGTHLLQWLEALGQLDALCALGTFAFNHEEYTYPIITDKPFVFRAKDMGHPLMHREQCVVNDVEIPQQPYFLIITGANMAGKSTYLRTIGCNYILACIGAPVCCSSLEIYPAHLMTSLRTSDSLANNESYFFAELKRLQQILDRLKSGEEMFIILDEILKGTNSMDKQKGSLALVKQLLQLKTNGIIATHDLLLGDLKQHFPDEISNYCFEADIQNNELTFSYQLREGVAQNMNACFLMQKMGIVID